MLTNILLIILIVITFLPILLSLITPKPPKTLNFENDILFLNFMINSKIDHCKKYIITPAKQAGVALMTNKDLEKYREGYVIEIYAQISNDYKKVLMKYFSEEGLRFYIVNSLNDSITSSILQHNIKFFNKDNTTNESPTVRATDMN